MDPTTKTSKLKIFVLNNGQDIFYVLELRNITLFRNKRFILNLIPSSKMLQNLPYFMNTKTQSCFFHFSFSEFRDLKIIKEYRNMVKNI